ncbi:MAG: ATP-dependent Clp protease proteolytic subunit [Legionellales bacterium]|nr:ATP-dependent Clp protease proteolytic subunit [Legionellales bacterium]|tara:strand:+ start:92146 stop:92724 length:579 start_codon:yes stop_codon:yes gene_type:complete
MAEKKDTEKDQPDNKVASKALFESRTILFFGEMKQEVSKALTEQLLAMAHVSDDPIKLIINSPGGHVESGDTIHDLIKFIKPDVKVIGTGCVASIASHIFFAPKLEDRLCLPNTRFLLHQPSGGMMGQETDINIQAREIVRMKQRINNVIAEATGQDYDKVAKDTERDYWMSAEEAVAYGMVGRIVDNIGDV